MGLVTVAVLREHVETDLSDDALQRLLDDAEAAVDKKAGELTTETDTYEGEILATALFLSRKASSITTVTEELKDIDGGYEETILSENDFKLRYGGRQMERLPDGDHPRRTWGDVVTVVYTPLDETAERTRVIIDLTRLAVQYNALKSEGVGDYKSASVDYEAEREKILSRLEGWPWA